MKQMTSLETHAAHAGQMPSLKQEGPQQGPQQGSRINSRDRLAFGLFLAAALHGVVILGITHNRAVPQASAPVLDLVLVRDGFGDLPENPDSFDSLDSLASANRDAPNENSEAAETAQTETTLSGHALLAEALKMAGLEARHDQPHQNRAGSPRVRRLSSLSTAASTDANYLESWRRKVQRIGSLNYPEEARRRKIYGSLRLMVAVLPDGSLKEVELLESSGHPVLDEAAIRIVRLAAPFAPFPDELRKTTDVLEIIRTWHFRKNSSFWGG